VIHFIVHLLVFMEFAQDQTIVLAIQDGLEQHVAHFIVLLLVLTEIALDQTIVLARKDGLDLFVIYQFV